MDNTTLKEIIEMIKSMSARKFDTKLPVVKAGDPMTAIVHGLNFLSDELEENVVERSLLAKKNEELEQALREVSEYKSAIDTASIVAITDTDGTIQYVNDLFCEVSKYSRSELIGQNHSIINSGFHQKHFWVGMWQTISQGNIWRAEIKNRAKDRIHYWVDLTIVPFMNKDHRPVKFLSMGHDITNKKDKQAELQKYQQKLEQVNKNLEQFAHTLSHDLKAPLNNAKGLITLIENTIDNEDPELVQYIDLLKQTNEKMRSLIDGILSYSRAVGTEKSIEKINLNDFVSELTKTTSTGGRIKVNISQKLPTVHYNPIKLKQVLENLFSNAVKFNDKDVCVIDVDCKSDTYFHNISIKDNGPGIGTEYQDKIFEMFNKVNTNNKIDSSGIGLATTKKIVQEAGGNIWVESEKGYGSKFIFSIGKRAVNVTEA